MVLPQHLQQRNTLSPQLLSLPVQDANRMLHKCHIRLNGNRRMLNNMRKIRHVLLQHGYMKHIVDSIQRRWQSKTISNRSDLLQNPKRPDIPRVKLTSLPKPDNTLGRRNPQKNMISDLKEKPLPPLVRITFLPTLCCQKPLLNHLHLLSTVLNQFRTKQPPLTNFIPTYR